MRVLACQPVLAVAGVAQSLRAIDPSLNEPSHSGHNWLGSLIQLLRFVQQVHAHLGQNLLSA
jgi:hypothetical protein